MVYGSALLEVYGVSSLLLSTVGSVDMGSYRVRKLLIRRFYGFYGL